MKTALYQGVGPPYQRGVQSREGIPPPKADDQTNATGGGVA